MPAHKVVTDQQLEMIVDFMEGNRELALGHYSKVGPLDKKKCKSKWEALSAKLNSVEPGARKTTAKWRDYWNERKYTARKRAQIHYNIVEGACHSIGPPMVGVRSAINKRIINILGTEAVLSSKTLFNKPSDEPIIITVPGGTSPLPRLSPVPSPEPQLADPPSPSRASTSSRHSSRSQLNTGEPDPHPSHWILQIEERRVAAEERLTQAMVDMASGIKTISQSLERMDRSLQVIATVHLANQGSR